MKLFGICQMYLAGLAMISLTLALPVTEKTVTVLGTPTTTTVVVTPTPTIASSAPQFINAIVFTSAVLNSTNLFRSEFNASNVSWNNTLASFASSYLASMGSLEPTNGSECNWSHSGGPYGENIALGCDSVTGCIDLWAQEAQQYNYDQPGFSEQTGHFTQLVWKGTTTVGCGSRLCGTRGWYLICEYWPRGNVAGEFSDEVDPQVSNETSWVKAGVNITTLSKRPRGQNDTLPHQRLATTLV